MNFRFITLATMRKIAAESALYIKLGRGGDWEDECISSGKLRFGYRETPHELCVAGQWRRVQVEREQARGNAGVAKSDTTQIRYFYEAGPKVLWVTFYKHALWWCFAEPKVTLLPDGTKVRTAVGGWKCTDILSRPLVMSSLSGKLLSMQGFRGTICQVKEQNYLLRKLNAEERPEVVAVKAALGKLYEGLESVIRTLTWKDFEILVDLIFRQAGWQRVSPIGSTTKSLDLDLISPISAERYGVQVKSQADRRVFETYKNERLADMQGFSRFYFVVHSPNPDLAALASGEDEDVRLLLPADIARLASLYGLSEWVIEKAG